MRELMKLSLLVWLFNLGILIDIDQLLEVAKTSAFCSGKKIMEVYKTKDFFVDTKDDDSPLTLADKLSHLETLKYLTKTNIPILSEEGRHVPYEERKKWEYFWMVDPLDGTKEFIKKNGEFTVNIALIHNNIPVLGVVYVPVLEEMFWAVKGSGAFRIKNGMPQKINSSNKPINDSNLKVVVSRSHLNEKTKKFIEKLTNPVLISKGSSLKFLLVATGEADIYPRFAPTMEWDVAASHIIVKEAGGTVVLSTYKSELKYNKEHLLNPYFIVLPFKINS